MTTKDELLAKEAANDAKFQASLDRLSNIRDVLKTQPQNSKYDYIEDFANDVILDKSGIYSPAIVIQARAYITERKLQIKLSDQYSDLQAQIRALESNNTPTKSSPSTPAGDTKPTLDSKTQPSTPSNTPKALRTPAQQLLEDEANKKAGLAVEEAIAEREQGRGYDVLDSIAEAKKPTLSPSSWGVKISSASSTYYMNLLPAISGNLNGTGHMDVPNVMPGLNFKFLSSYAKHKIPGWAPVYQALGIDTVLVTMIGMFTGEDGTTVPVSANAPEVKGLTSPLTQGTNFNKNDHTTAALNRTTNKLDTYENLQSFINFGVQKQQTVTIEVNIAKNGEIRPTSKTTGGIRGSNGNPTFSGIIRSLDTYYRRFDRTYYILTMEITKGIGNDCAGKPLNLTNKLDEVVKSQLAKMENSCKVGVTEGGKEIAAATPEEINAACYQYKKEGESVYAFTLDKSAIIRTFKFDYATNGNIIKTTPLQALEGASAISFLRSNTDVTQRKGCSGPVGDKDSRIKLFVEGVNENYVYKTALPDVNTLSLTGSPQRTSLNGSTAVGFDYSRYYSLTSQGYFVEIQTTKTDKLLSDGKSVTKIIGIPDSTVTFLLNNRDKEQGYTDIETFLNSGLLKRKDSFSTPPVVTNTSTTAPQSTAGKS